MRTKEKIFIASLIAFLFIFVTYQFVAFNPELFLKESSLISEEMEPPGDLDADLDMAYQHILFVEIQHQNSNFDIEIKLILDNETFHIISLLAASGEYESGSVTTSVIIPIDEESSGEFEIIVIKSEGVISVEYNIFRDPPKFFMFFFYDLGKFFPYIFLILFVAFFIYICLKMEKKR